MRGYFRAVPVAESSHRRAIRGYGRRVRQLGRKREEEGKRLYGLRRGPPRPLSARRGVEENIRDRLVNIKDKVAQGRGGSRGGKVSMGLSASMGKHNGSVVLFYITLGIRLTRE